MNRILKNNSKLTNKQAAHSSYKNKFIIACVVMIILLIGMFTIRPSELDTNGCPTDKNQIGLKNIVILDVTDVIPKSSIGNLDMLFDLATSEQPNWLMSGKKVDQTTFYMLSSSNPSDMEPIGIFCKKPPSIVIGLGESESKMTKNKELIKNRIASLSLSIKNQDEATRSKIIQTIATVTSSANWKNGSNLILFSDLEEISPECGNFAKNVPNIQEVSSDCKKWIAIAKANMSNDDTKSGIEFREILRDKTKQDGLIKFWKNYRQIVANPGLKAENGDNK